MNTRKEKRQSILDLVSASPVAAARKDRELWLSLFADDAWIEDPAGSKRFSSGEVDRSLATFYDIFIRDTDLRVHAEQDYVSGNEVVRDATIEIRMPRAGSLNFPAYLHYQISDAEQITGLRAYWALLSAVGAALRGSNGGAGYLVDLGRRLQTATGIRGLGGLLNATGVTPAIGKVTAHRLKDYLETGRFYEATLLFGNFDEGAIRIRRGESSVSLPPNFLTTGQFRLLDVSKMVAAGRYVVFRLSLLLNGEKQSGVGILTFSRPGLKIMRLEIFL